jgi:hypothetical protein
LCKVLLPPPTHQGHMTLLRSDPVACCLPSSLCTHPCRCLFFLSSLLGGVVVGCRHHHVWLVAQDMCLSLSMDSVSHSRHSHCAHESVSLLHWQACLFVFPPPLVGAELGQVQRLQCFVFFFCKHLCLCLCKCLAADLKLLWTEGADKLVRITKS